MATRVVKTCDFCSKELDPRAEFPCTVQIQQFQNKTQYECCSTECLCKAMMKYAEPNLRLVKQGPYR